MAINYEQLIDVLNKTIYAINFITILGSVLSFIIFSRKAFERSSIGFYCKYLAIFDLFVVLYFGFGIASIVANIPLINYYDPICKIYNYIQTAASPIPGWILVAFSFDQLAIVSRTERFGFVKKRWFQHLLIIGLFIFHCSIYFPIVFVVSVRKYSIQNATIYSCDPNAITMPIVYLLESILIPFVFLIISISLLVRILIKSREKISSNLHGNSLVCRRYQEYKFAFNSVVLSILFMVLSTPVVLTFILNQAGILVSYWDFRLVNIIGYVLFYLNYALHFWVHFTFNAIFRNEFLVLLRIKKLNDSRNSTSRI